MEPVPHPRLRPSRDEAIEDWPWLDQDVLRSSRSRQVCMTRHVFRHHLGLNGIPLLTCHLHQGLMAHGEHLTHRPSRWDCWCQQLGITVGELLPGEAVPLLNHRRELSREAGIMLWEKSARRAGPLAVPCGELCRSESFPLDLLPNPG